MTDPITHMNTLAEIDDLRARLDAALRENAGLAAIVERLPKTADGVPVVPGDVVFHPTGHYSHVTDRRGVRLYGNGEWVDIESCYSTIEAAEAAAEAAVKGGG